MKAFECLLAITKAVDSTNEREIYLSEYQLQLFRKETGLPLKEGDALYGYVIKLYPKIL
jgi:hypothetical protein